MRFQPKRFTDSQAMPRTVRQLPRSTPQKVGKTAEFMFKIGTIKTKPASWKELFFPEVHALQGD